MVLTINSGYHAFFTAVYTYPHVVVLFVPNEHFEINEVCLVKVH